MAWQDLPEHIQERIAESTSRLGRGISTHEQGELHSAYQETLLAIDDAVRKGEEGMRVATLWECAGILFSILDTYHHAKAVDVAKGIHARTQEYLNAGGEAQTLRNTLFKLSGRVGELPFLNPAVYLEARLSVPTR